MVQLSLYCFGPPRLELERHSVDLPLRKAMALLVYLAIKKGKRSRDELATLFWPESSQSGARASLRRTLYIINKDLNQNILSTDQETVSISSKIHIWTDVDAFRQLVIEGTSKAIDSPQKSDSLLVLESAVEFYKDDFLSGFSLRDSPGFDEWQFFEADSLRQTLVSILNELVSSYESLGDCKKAIQYGRRWLSLDPLHEPAHRLLMRLFEESGQYTAALRQYKECERVLSEELGVSPQPETNILYRNLLINRANWSKKKTKFQPEVNFVASGDVHIAYVVFGSGPPDIFMVSGFINHMEYLWEQPNIASFFNELASFSRVIMFDRRGVGLSDRVGYAPTLDHTIDDILAVMKIVGSRNPVLFGYLEGGPNSMLFAATYPDRLRGLILYGTQAKWTRSEDYPWTLTKKQYDRWLESICDHWGDPINLNVFAPSSSHETELQDWWAKMMRLASSPGAIKAVLEVMRDIDIRDILPTIQCPTLILQRKGDRAIRVGATQYLAERIPNAKYVELDGQDHWFFIGESRPILKEMKEFVSNLESPSVPSLTLVTILLIDLMEITREGFVYGHDRNLAYQASVLISDEIRRFRGTEVGWKEDRFTATFDGPTRAIQCAIAIIKRASKDHLILRAGLHTGECERVGSELRGPALQIADSILNIAGEREVLVSRTVKDLVVGSGFQLAFRERCEIDGIKGSWEIFSIN